MRLQNKENNKILQFTIYGERCSGTHFLQHAIQKNFEIEYVRGDKHFFGFSDVSKTQENTLFFIIIRNSIDWIDSMWRSHYHVPDENLQSFEGFVGNEWWSANNFEDQDGSEILEDRHIYEKRRYRNIFEMRRVKYSYLLNDLFPRLDHVVFLTYEELCADYQKILTNIQLQFNLVRLNDMLEKFQPVPYYKGNYSDLYTARACSLHIKEQFHVLANVDILQEQIDFKYIIPKTVLVTGGNGLVGRAMQAHHHHQANYLYLYLSSADCDLRNKNATKLFFSYTSPSIVIHLACNCGGLYKNMAEPITMYEDNMLINLNTIKSAHEAGVDIFMGCLSTCIFPDKTAYPVREGMLHDGPPHESNKGYAYAKRMLEVHCEMYRRQHGRKYFCVTPTNIYGPFDNFTIRDAHVIPALIHKAYLAQQRGDTHLIVNGTGSAQRQFIFSKDLATIIFDLMDKASQNLLSTDESHVIITPSIEHSISKIAEFIASRFGLSVEYDFSKSDGQIRKFASNDLLLSILKPKTEYDLFQPLFNGLEETIQWFKSMYNNTTCVMRK